MNGHNSHDTTIFNRRLLPVLATAWSEIKRQK